MNNSKTTRTNNHVISEFEKAENSSRDVKINETMNDRPAIFIEELKGHDEYNRSIKNN
jgi:hypothetical protein